MEGELINLFQAKSVFVPPPASLAVRPDAKSKNQLKRELKAALRLETRDQYLAKKREKQRQKRKLKRSGPDHAAQSSRALSEIKDASEEHTAEKNKDGFKVCEGSVVVNRPIPNPPRPDRTCRGTILFDTAFDEFMLKKEHSSLAAQLARCHSINKKAKTSFYKLMLGPVSPSFSMLLDKFYANKWEETLLFTETQAEAKPSLAGSSVKNVLYLSADAEKVLGTDDMLDPSLVLVIGALVDRNRHKGLGRKRAESLGLVPVKLPIQEAGISLSSSAVLTVNQGTLDDW